MESGVFTLLQELNLSKQEIEAYETALGLGTFTASIIGARLGIPRSTARYTCEWLIRKGLMIETKKGNTKLFIAENPTKLFSILHEQEAEIARKKEQLTRVVKKLEEKYNPNARLPKITFYEGIDGVERMFNELLLNPTTLYSFGAGDYFLQKEPGMIESFRKKSKNVYKDTYVMRAPKYHPLHNNKIAHRYNQYFQFIEELKVDIQIVDDVLTIASLENSSPIGVVIKHQEIVNAFKAIFIELWKRMERDGN